MSDEPDMVSHATLAVEAVKSDKPRGGEEVQTEEGTAQGQLSKEQFMQVTFSVPKLKEPVLQEKTHVILVIDKSGSMAGQAWKQVQVSLVDILSQTVNRAEISTDVIIYSQNAKLVDFDKTNYTDIIQGLSAGGMTNFKAAFTKLYNVMIEADKTFKQTVIVFMTDGVDTANTKDILPLLVPKLKEKLGELETQSVIHAVGFTSGHDFKFLKDLAEKGGKSAGMFRYCEAQDSRKALQDKLDELFDFILLSNEGNTSLDVQFTDKDNLILNSEKPSHCATLKAHRMDEELQEQTGYISFISETWVQLKKPLDQLSVDLSVQTNILQNGETKSVTIPCILDKTEFKLLESDFDKTQWRLKILTRNVDNLVTRASIAITEKKDTSSMQTKIEKYQTLITHIQVFGNGITKQTREKLFASIKEIQGTLDRLQAMLAEYVRAGTSSVSLLARAHDLRYQAVFSKSRRQRAMDKRASKNMAYAATAQQTLTNLTIDKQEVDRLSQDAMQFYFCVLSQNSIQDVLLGDDKEDAIGFGLAVKRSEVVLDEPTLMKIFVISGTLVSRTAMLDALEYKINVSSHLKAHGGFSFKDRTLGVTTVGSSREPINAWLPLYVTKSHWDRVKVILQPALGSFCTLDPLGYHFKQLDVMFMVLGSMIGQLNMDNVGEHQLRLIFSVQRTCAACVADFDLSKQVADTVEQFVTSPAGRTRDVIPHLYTLLGYIVSMPTETARTIFKMEDENNNNITQFWLAFIAEWLRRATGSLYKDSKKPVLNGIVNAILHGSGNNGEDEDPIIPNATAELIRLCLDDSVTELDVDTEPFDPVEGMTEPSVELTHDQTIDRAMEVWAEKTTGHQKNIGKTKKYKDALRVVRIWNRGSAEIMSDYATTNQNPEIREEAGPANASADEDSDEETQPEAGNQTVEENKVTSQLDCQTVTLSILKLISQLQHRVCQAAYPGIETLPGCMAFVNYWLSRKHTVEALDSNSGIAPDSWIQEVKVAVRPTCEEIHDYTNKQIDGKEVTEDTAVDNKDVLETGEVVEDTSDIVQTDGNQESISKDGDKDNSNHDNQPDGNGPKGNAHKPGKIPKTKTSLPALLHYVDNKLDVVKMTRAILCQVISYHSNSVTRAAITSKEFIDLSVGDANAEALLKKCDEYLADYKHTARKGIFEQAVWKRANYCMMRASTPWAFAGYLMNTYTTRSEGFIDLIDLFLATISTGEIPPYLQEKIHILFTGKYKDHSVLDKGNQMLPVGKLAEKVTNILGNQAWEELNRELRSTVQIHVYRESDIPNRHGHCNSNPFIPNSLREKLGMPLLSKNRRNPLNKRKR